MTTPADIQHQAFLQVVGEMWHELQKFKGKDRRLSLEIEDFFGVAAISSVAGWVDQSGHCRVLKSKVMLFREIPEVMDTTMMFRELSECQRRKARGPSQ